MKRVLLAASGVFLVALWGFSGRGALGVKGEGAWTLVPNGTTWPLGAWGLPLAVLFLFGGAALLSVYDRFNRAKSRKEQTNSLVTALVCLALLCALWPWTLLGPGAPQRINAPSQSSRLTLEGRFNLLASQWSDVATEYFGTAYEIGDARAFTRTYASTRQNPTAPALSHVATHPPGATLWFYGARRFVEGVPGLNDSLNSLAARVTGQDEAPLYASLNDLRATASRSAGVPAPAPLPRGAIGVALFCAMLMGLSLVAALPAVYGLAASGANENGQAEARGLLACALWVLAPSLNLFAFSLDALVACGAAWTLFFASRALTTSKRRWALLTGLALAATTMLSFGALALGLVLVLAALVARIERRLLLRVAGWAFSAFFLAWLVAAAWGTFNPLEVAHKATVAHRFATLSVRPLWPWDVLNLCVWTIFCGWPLVVCLAGATLARKELIIRSGTRKEAGGLDIVQALALGTILTLCVLSFSGQVRGEVERLWLFLLAPLAAFVLVGRGKTAVALVVLQAVQTLVMAVTLAPLIRPLELGNGSKSQNQAAILFQFRQKNTNMALATSAPFRATGVSTLAPAHGTLDPTLLNGPSTDAPARLRYDPRVYAEAQSGLVRRDMSHFGRFRVWGKDAAALLHHLTTQDVKNMRPGEVREAVLVNNKARVLDWVTIMRRHESDFWVITSPNRKQTFSQHAIRYVLFRQDVKIDDVAADDALFGVFGPLAAEVPGPKWPTRRLPCGGFLTFGATDGAMPCDTDTFNILRVECGLPVAGSELTEDFNPWEANFDFAISPNKGCYNGQEIIARLNTYQKIKQKLVGIQLEKPNTGRVLLRFDGKDAGLLTSSTVSPRFGPIGLAYVRNDWNAVGTQLEVVCDHPQKATVCELPFFSS